MSYFSKHPEKIVIKHTKREYINTLDELEHIKTKHTVKYPLIKITKYITSGYLLTFLYQYINSLSKKWLYLFAFLPGLIVFLSVMIPSYLSDYFDYMNPLAKIKNRIYFEKYLRQCINKIDQSKKNN
ncbi:hypothetical protein [Apilactobacillus ozensis]|uniref:hypothetical protein n=1 Tax=Apilactobacillus ozensis TaxID=866801 RepID=UPI0006D1C471|nr:hypothetical protein [Apilactobacillus ozensis]